MSENSNIEWTTHTFNPWWGCQKVSAGCKNCYAETLDHRWGGNHFGPTSDRKPMSEKYWGQPIKWNAAAQKANKAARVFCASMADVFEDHPQTVEHRERLFDLIMLTPWLDWQLLTKRPENIMRLTPAGWKDEFPENVWVGTSVENGGVEERILHLIQVPARVLFLSVEPMLGPVYIPIDCADGSSMINWVICGAESGPGARPMELSWARDLARQCNESGTAFFMKQICAQGKKIPYENFPWELQVRQFPDPI